MWDDDKPHNNPGGGALFNNWGWPIIDAARPPRGAAADPPIMPQAEQGGQSDPLGATASQLYQEQMRLGPDPGVRNPDVAQVYLELKNLKPDFGQVIQGLFTGQLKDTKAAMQDLQDRAGKELDRAIKAAQAKGAKVSRDDWKFANWDPAKDYTEADYQQSR
ncbi:MAG: hypothetical protein ACTHMJ_11460, partial [Thermomicrobiales bacterium]